jgi:hypothetical protein
MKKTNINPEILQTMLESAVNAADKGQSQFFTPAAFGQALAAALPKPRPGLIDLTCGRDDLLQAAANPTTHLLGADIDPCRPRPKDPPRPEGLPVSRVTRDLTRLYPLLVDLNARFDCLVLNPPWRLFWHRDRLAALAESDCPAVRNAFAAAEPTDGGGCPRGAIDSTIATLLIALDRCTLYGEGLLIANNATLERLLFVAGAPYAALAQHIWLHLKIPGNPMTARADCNFQHDPADGDAAAFHTGVIYFALDHTTGPKHFTAPGISTSTSGTLDFGLGTLDSYRTYRQGAELRSVHNAHDDVLELWQAIKERCAEEAGARPRVPYNLWLTVGGRIKADLSRYEVHSGKTDKREAARLFALRDKAPMELVLQRAQRDELLHVAGPASRWKVHPELLAAVQRAVTDYHAARAPLYPLPEIQRLGYLDEQDSIRCTADLDGVFTAGQTYPLRTQTVPVTRRVKKPNGFTGEDEDLEFTGQELALYLKTGLADDAPEMCFMDAKLKNDPLTRVGTAEQQKVSRFARYTPKPENQTINYTLQDLVTHFEIPEVPDVATVNPDGYKNYLNHLDQLETLLA